jgi:MOSC domain-containing protein YiiM
LAVPFRRVDLGASSIPFALAKPSLRAYTGNSFGLAKNLFKNNCRRNSPEENQAKSTLNWIEFTMASVPRIVCIYISPGHNFYGRYGLTAEEHPIIPVPQVECIAGKGLVGDRFFDYKQDYKGQITFFAWETYEDLCRHLGVSDKNPGAFRRNVVTRGVDLNEWIGKEFEIQGVLFEGTQEASPCLWMNQAFCEGAVEAMKGRGGLRAKILTDGPLRIDEK